MSQLRHPDEIRDDIEQSREELAAAVEALAAKADVKAMARAKADDAKRLIASVWTDHKVLLIAGTAVIVALIVARSASVSQPAQE